MNFTFACFFVEMSIGGVAELVDCTGLENRRTGDCTGGSNPSSSAKVLVLIRTFFHLMVFVQPLIHFVYILFSRSTNSFYKGQTKNLLERLQRHNNGMEKFTCKGTPWILVWSTPKYSRKDSMELEIKLKNLSRKRLIQFISKYSDDLKISLDDWSILRGS